MIPDTLIIRLADSIHIAAAILFVKLHWYQYFFFFFYAFILGVGLRFIFKAPGLGVKDVWNYINANTKEVLKSGLCWLLVYGLWITGPQWTDMVKWKWAYVFNYFWEWRYWSPLVAWLADSIVGNLLVWAQMLLDYVKSKMPKPPADPPLAVP
jgi:hypothetical protein